METAILSSELHTSLLISGPPPISTQKTGVVGILFKRHGNLWGNNFLELNLLDQLGVCGVFLVLLPCASCLLPQSLGKTQVFQDIFIENLNVFAVRGELWHCKNLSLYRFYPVCEQVLPAPKCLPGIGTLFCPWGCSEIS